VAAGVVVVLPQQAVLAAAEEKAHLGQLAHIPKEMTVVVMAVAAAERKLLDTMEKVVKVAQVCLRQLQDLWFTTAAEAADHLRAMKELVVLVAVVAVLHLVMAACLPERQTLAAVVEQTDTAGRVV